ncbi:copper resistance CopC family protein [Nonomuraea indica]|uniref:copper resistance CopC family protein n=1 Tax=Nonomuraea indica TaxID=1581193 RepID=UPI000C7CC6C1|nr:copper resistance CopC family protein [Nonomuraea indica]
MKRSPLAAITAILAALFLLGTAGPALAHDSLKSSDPAKGSTVKTVEKVTLEFTSRVRMPVVVVHGPGDEQHQLGKPELDEREVTQELKGALPDGRYTIAYRVVSSDGHPIEGEIPFTVKGATPSAAPSETSSAVDSAPPSPEPTGEPATGEPAAQGGTAAATAPAAQESGAGASFPVWLLVVVGALAGIGIGLVLSVRKKRT